MRHKKKLLALREVDSPARSEKFFPLVIHFFEKLGSFKGKNTAKTDALRQVQDLKKMFFSLILMVNYIVGK